MTPEQWKSHELRLKDLVRICRETIELTPLVEEDSFGFLLFSYLLKQIQHTETLLVLPTNRDSWLVARSMLEAYFQLLYIASNDPKKLAEQWRAFVWVSDWRKLQRKKSNGAIIEPSQMADIERGLQKYAHLFLTPKAAKAKANSAPMPRDPYSHTWIGMGVRDIFYSLCDKGVETDAIDMFYSVYGYFSEWHHSSVSGTGRAIVRNEKDEIVEWNVGTLDEYGEAVKIAFLCLAETLILFMITFRVGDDVKIQEIKKEYFASMGFPVEY